MSTDELNRERMEELENLLVDPDRPEFTVFKIKAYSGKLELKEIATVRAIDEDLAIITVAENHPADVTERLFALPAGSVRGRRVNLTHYATLED